MDCFLLFNILEPNEEQQVELFKMFKTKVTNEEKMIDIYNKLNNRIKKLNFIAISYFYE